MTATARHSAAWVSASDGGTGGRLHVAAVGDGLALGAPTGVRDALAAIEPHGEAPPELAHAPNGGL